MDTQGILLGKIRQIVSKIIKRGGEQMPGKKTKGPYTKLSRQDAIKMKDEDRPIYRTREEVNEYLEKANDLLIGAHFETVIGTDIPEDERPGWKARRRYALSENDKRDIHLVRYKVLQENLRDIGLY